MTEQWFIFRHGEQYGPYTWEQLVSFYRGGNLVEEDLLWSQALVEWTHANQVPGLWGMPEMDTEEKPEGEEKPDPSEANVIEEHLEDDRVDDKDIDEAEYKDEDRALGSSYMESPKDDPEEPVKPEEIKVPAGKATEEIAEESREAPESDQELTEIPKTPPRALRNFMTVFMEGFATAIRSIGKRQLLLMGLVFLAIFLVNLYLVVFVNDGFAVRGRERWYYPIMAVDGTKVTVTIFWLTFIILVHSVVNRVKAFGLSRFFKDLVQSPSWLGKSISDAGDAWAIPLLFWMALALLVSILIENPFTLMALALIAFFAFNAQTRGTFFYLAYLAALDWNYYFKKSRYLNLALISLGLFGLFLGLLVSFFLPFQPFSVYILAALLLVLVILIKIKSISSAAAAGTGMVIAVFCALFSQTGSVWAHDGGFQEGGGNLIDWLRSAGAWAASTMGFESGVAGGLWSMFSSVFSRAGLGAAMQAAKIPGIGPTPVGPGLLDVAQTFGNIAAADNPRDANLAAAEALSFAYVPGLRETMGGLTSDFINFSPGSGDGGDSGDSGSGRDGGRPGSRPSRRRRRGFPYEPPSDDN